jgi:hypothetical protein
MSTYNEYMSELIIKSEDTATEIWVSDGQFCTVANGLGHLDVQLVPGIYRVRAATGSQRWEDLVALQPGQVSNIQIPRLPFNSPIPLPNTALANEYLMVKAHEEYQNEHVKAGSGSAIFIFLHNYNPDGAARPSSPQHLAQGLTVRDVQDNMIADLSTKSAADPAESHMEPWAACNIAVDPGFYRLCLELPMDTILEQSIIASPGWQTQIYTLQQSYGSETGDQWADLPGASIFYSRYPLEAGQTAAPDYEQMRLSELAKIGSIKRWNVLGNDVMEAILNKSGNPMLGILSGHILLFDKEPDLELLRMIITSLRRLIGQHPDVEALALAVGSGLEDGSYIFEAPPMLRRSWSLILKATVHKPELVPLDSLASRVSQSLWGHSPWLICTDQPEQHEVAFMELAPSINTLSKEDFEIKEKVVPKLSETEELIVNQLKMAGYIKERNGNVMAFSIADVQKLRLDDETLEKLVDIMGLPRANLEDTIYRLLDKL